VQDLLKSREREHQPSGDRTAKELFLPRWTEIWVLEENCKSHLYSYTKKIIMTRKCTCLLRERA